MERLGFWGIIKLTTHLVFSHFKHFLCITLLVALPYALNFIVLGPLLKAYVILYEISASQGRLEPSNDFPPLSEQQHHSLSLSLLIFLAIFNIVVSFFCILLVAFSVCRACLDKSLDMKGSLRGVLRSANNLILTWLVEFAVIIAFNLVCMLVMMIIAYGLLAVNANVVMAMTVMTMGMVGGGIYMTVAFSLASAVAILEETKGWEAMRRSMYLTQGSRWVVLGLYGFYAVLSLAVSLVSVSEEASVVWRWGAGGASVGLQAFIAVCSMVSMVVLYMSCKRGHGEPLDSLVAVSAQFGPPEVAAKYLDLEAAALTTTKQ